MSSVIKLAALTAAFSLIMPISEAEARPGLHASKRYAEHQPQSRLSPAGPWTCSDCYPGGWRYRPTARGWDNSCVNVPWLPSGFACSAK